MIFENFSDVITYLNGTYNSENVVNSLDDKSFRVDRERDILKMLGDPQKLFKIIHVAGSKGKGTTVGHIAMLLKNGKRRIGLYMSPHVYDYRERWTYCKDKELSIGLFTDEEYIEAARAMEAVLKDHKKLTTLPGGIPPTPFELYTAYAFLLFKLTKMDYAVVETGIGGRLDATNVVDPIATVITHIEKEHTNILGNTIEEITKEKAGIIKEDVPTFAMNESETISKILECTAIEHGTKITFAPTVPPKKLNLRMRGESAERDYLLAYTTVSELGLLGDEPFSYNSQILTLPARGDVFISGRSVLLLDGAHTKDSIQECVNNIDDIVSNANLKDMSRDYLLNGKIDKFMNYAATTIRKAKKRERAVIFSCSKDKSSEEMLRILIQSFDTICLTNIKSIYKKSDIVKNIVALEKVLNETKSYRVKNILESDNVDDAIAQIESLYGTKDKNNGDKVGPNVIVITGSFYLCADYITLKN